eukprot:6211987-Pleurochrysis_carterae.AAC.6
MLKDAVSIIDGCDKVTDAFFQGDASKAHAIESWTKRRSDLCSSRSTAASKPTREPEQWQKASPALLVPMGWRGSPTHRSLCKCKRQPCRRRATQSTSIGPRGCLLTPGTVWH